MGVVNDITSKTFGELTVIKRVGSKNRKALWLCKCSCGSEKIIIGSNLTSGNTKSCGCIHNKQLSDMHKINEFTENRLNALRESTCTTHKMSKTSFYKRWRGMHERCYYVKHKHYKYYGDKGISVDIKWHDFNNFYNDMYESFMAHCNEYGIKQTTLDRIDGNKNYEPSNCRWATWAQQNNNKNGGII